MKITMPTPLDDGLRRGEVGPWAEDKYCIAFLYDTLFSSGMKNKWDRRVYIDLYAGAGQVRIRGTNKLMFGSPLLALQVKDPFDKYIFCEEDPELLAALKARTARIAPGADVSFVPGNCNVEVQKIIAQIPKPSKEQTVLSFCFVDPFDLGIHFKTVEALSRRFTDFLVLLALYMDANRNYENYVKEQSAKVSLFLGDPDWRKSWDNAKQNRVSFPLFLANSFSTRMAGLNYLKPPLRKSIRSSDKNLRLYELALFSRDPKAYEFWEDVLKYSTDQTKFSF